MNHIPIEANGRKLLATKGSVAVHQCPQPQALKIEHQMTGDSPAMRQVYKIVERVAPSNSTVLICGETGTGKELVARAIHRNSLRSSKPFLAVNCAVLTEELLASDLFGHEKGAFTDAKLAKNGILEEALGGTIFLDEIGELALGLQSKLLRVLQEREFYRLGSTRLIKADIRLIAATNRNLRQAVNAGTFREDLYFRINVVSITLPPLRERREDIPRLVSHFIDKHGSDSLRHVAGCSEEALASLLNYYWPGNVRELENAIESAIVLGFTPVILPEDLPESVAEAGKEASAGPPKFRDQVRRFKEELVLKAFEQGAGKYSEAAKLLGMHPNNLHRLIRALKLQQLTNHRLKAVAQGNGL